MTDRTSLVALVTRHEGTRLMPYIDTALKMSIGVGRNLTDDGISGSEALLMLNNDLDTVLADLETFAWWAGLSDQRQQAIADVRFNVGPGGFRLFRKLIHALAVEDYITAGQEIRNSQIAPARKYELAQMMEQG